MKYTHAIAVLALAASVQASEDVALPIKGTVREVLSGGGYTYMHLQSETDLVWVASYAMAAKAGDPAEVTEGRLMRDFSSSSLQRDFDRIIFASAVRVGTNTVATASKSAALPAGHPPVGGTKPDADALPAGHPPIAGAEAGAGKLPAGHPPVGGASHGGGGFVPQDAGELIRGEVIETMNAAGYTYVHVKTEAGEVWAAANQFAIAKGDRVEFSSGMVMPNFESPTLKRTFEKIYFVDGIRKTGEKASALPAGHP